MQFKIIFNIGIPIALISVFLLSCSKLVDVGPPKTQLVTSSVFTSDQTANAAITAIYIQMTSFPGTNGFPNGGFSVFGALAADEINFQGQQTDYHEINENAITVANSTIDNFWNNAYQYIYMANAVIEGLKESTGVSDSVKKQLSGEAYFIRAFCHFYLLNYFGDIPLITTTDYMTNSVASRTSISAVYTQVVDDLLLAQGLLAMDYSFSFGERVRPNHWVATALLSKVYLYMGDWADAELQATAIINDNTDFNLSSDLTTVFQKNGPEAIWQLIPVSSANYYCVQDAEWFITAVSELPNGSMTPELLNDFEPGDNRETAWVDSITIDTATYYFPFKYRVKGQTNTTEYYTLFRLAEQYLIRSEARAEQNNVGPAISDLNVIRARAGLPALSNAISQSGCLSAIMQERRIELFCECGNRWLDLKRTGNANVVLTPLKPEWSPTDTLFPIPQSERQKDPNLTQNPGY